MYPIGFTSIAGYLERFGHRVKIVNLAARMVHNRRFDVEKKIRGLEVVRLRHLAALAAARPGKYRDRQAGEEISS